ncbi:hypothetical protein SAMN02910315_00433, partial [Methanobrevibacter millerae]
VLNDRIEELTSKNVSLNEVVASKDDEAKVLNEKVEVLTTQNEKLSSENINISKNISDKDSNIESLISDFNNLTNKYEKNIKKYKIEIDSNESYVHELARVNNNLQQELNERIDANVK